ncbi:hypothetical protein QBK99_02690 [Corticibacterium sp. UT-5YL-CI-8]|nr:hypothetical protein [Tianweitania sp. UT-5YL-CI-8]
MREPVRKRIVLHFPGFEPLDAASHHDRYNRSAQQSAALWDIEVVVGPLSEDGRDFEVESSGPGWHTTSHIYLFDHSAVVNGLNGRHLPHRIASGFLSAARVIFEGGAFGYFKHAWRFGLFFVFPFLLVGLALAVSLTIAAIPYLFGLSPWFHLASVPVAYAFFVWLFVPWSDGLHTLHLFSDWEMAVAVARLDHITINAWLEECAVAARIALEEPADEYVISSHSMGSSVAVQVIGLLLEKEPALFESKRVVFATLGGAVLQCALLRSAHVLRARVGLIARVKELFWLEVHCLTDIVHFYKSRVAAAVGHPDAPQPKIAFIRLKSMLTPERYKRIKKDPLRVHRQYVLASDVRAPFDFTLMTAGPLPAASFAEYSQASMPQLHTID